MRDLTILKIGGSVLTNKALSGQLDMSSIGSLMIDPMHFGRLVIVNGLGSLGRAFLPMYSGRVLEPPLLARIVQRQLATVHHALVDQLTATGVPARSFNPEGAFFVNSGCIDLCACDGFNFSLDRAEIPVTYGGTLADSAGGYGVVSSDLIVETLARSLGAKRVIWASDVDGILAQGGTEGRVVKTLSPRNLGEMQHQEYDEHDLTAGMTGKVAVALRLAKLGISSIVVNGKRSDVIARCLAGLKTEGTNITA